MSALVEAYYRRLHSFDRVEEFYSPSQARDKDGQWTKLWSGVSAHPDNRTRPKRSGEVDPYVVFETDLGGGYRSVVTDYYSNGLKDHVVAGEIRKGNEKVGEFSRYIDDSQGGNSRVLVHENFEIHPEHRGQGLADRLNTHAVAQYQRLGVDRIELEAGLEVGGYAWARQGYRYREEANGDGSPSQERKTFLNHQLDRVEGQLNKPILREHAIKIRKEVATLKKAIEAGEDVQPIHIASIGEKYARFKDRDIDGIEFETWPGKSVLLGTAWHGVYYFDAAKPVTAAASDLAHAELRPAFKRDRPEIVRYVEGLIAAVCPHGVFEFACHDATCRPPGSGGTGGSRPGGTAVLGRRPPVTKQLANGANAEIRYIERLRAIGIADENNIGSEYDDADDEKRAANFRALVPEDLDGAVRSRIQPSQLESILKVGMLTQHDTGFSAGMFNPSLRELHEAAMFDEEETRPVYGYIHTTETIGTRLSQYGPIAVVFKNEVNDRTTVTYGDSLDENNPPAPAHLTEVRKASTMRLSHASTESGMRPGYVEAQIHGQIRPEHIAKLVIDKTRVNYGDEHRFGMIVAMAKRAGISVEEATDVREFESYGQSEDVLHFGVETMKIIARRGETEAWAAEDFDPATGNVELRTPGQPTTIERWQVALKFGGWEPPEPTPIVAAAQRHLQLKS